MHCRDGVDVQPEPSDRCDRKLCLDEVLGRAVAVGVIANEPRAVGELQDWTEDVKSHRACLPADRRPSGEATKLFLSVHNVNAIEFLHTTSFRKLQVVPGVFSSIRRAPEL